MTDSEIFAWIKHNNDYIHIEQCGYFGRDINVLAKSKMFSYDVSFNVYAWHETKQIVCAFEETQQKSDWKTNFDFWVRVCNGLKVHEGYDKQWHIIESAFREKLSKVFTEYPGYTVLVVGWSLGACLALRAVPEITSIIGRKVRLLTFGSPKMCFDGKTVEKFKYHLTADSVEYCNRNDLVTYCPPFGFRHVAKKTVGERFSLLKLLRPSTQHNIYEDLL